MSKWIHFDSDSTRRLALSLCKGVYQESLIDGVEAWSGSTLGGKAGRYGASYHRSRLALIERLEAAGLRVHFETIERRKVAFVEVKTCLRS